MGDVSDYITKFASAVQAFNRDDLQPLADLLDDRCEFTASGNLVAGTRDEFITAVKALRSDGWTTHNLLSIAGAGEFVISLYRNELRNGNSFIGAAVHRLGSDGRVVEIRAFDPADAMSGNG